LTNCLTEIFFAQAAERAKELNEKFKEARKSKGALFGLPISLKDQFQIKGTNKTPLYSKFRNMIYDDVEAECNMGIKLYYGLAILAKKILC